MAQQPAAMMFVTIIACFVLFSERVVPLVHSDDSVPSLRAARSLGRPIAAPGDGLEIERRRGLAEFLGNKIARARLTEHERCVLDSLPPDAVLVAQGDFDDVALLLNLSGIRFTSVNPKRLDKRLLRPCRTFFINSGSKLLRPTPKKPSSLRRTERRLKKFVLSGGVLVTTDLAISLLARNTSAFSPLCWNVQVKRRVRPFAISVSVSKATAKRRRKRTRCSSHPDIAKLYSEVALFLESFRSSPRWNLRPVSPLVQTRVGRCTAAVPRGLQKIYRSDDLPRRFDNLLFCGDMKRGSFFHVVGPLSQTFPEGGTEMTEFFMRKLMEQLAITEEERRQLFHIANSVREAGSVLSMESITTAAVAHDIVHRTILKAWLPQCARQDHVRRCAASTRTPPTSPAEVSTLSATDY